MAGVSTPLPVTPDALDPVIHERTRLALVAVLAARSRVDYLELRSLLKLTDGNLAGHLNVLEKAGYIDVEKTFVGKKPRTSYALTPLGRSSFRKHVEQLGALLQGARGR